MSIIDSLSVSVSGMTAQRQRVNTISENLANANTCLLYTSDAADD